MKHHIIIAILLVFANVAMAQQSTMWLTNGKKLTINDYKILSGHDGDSIVEFTKVNGKEKQLFKDEVFSVTKATGEETVVYCPNINIGDVLSVSEMRSYVLGRSDGKNTKISPFVSISAAAIGVGSGFIPSPEISNGETSISIPVGVLVPTAHAVVIGACDTPDKVLQKKFPDKLDDQYYIMGVDESLRKKRVTHSVIAGFAGLIVGSIIASSVY